MFTLQRQNIFEDIKSITKKSIFKLKQKNQFSTNTQFIEKYYDKDKQGEEQENNTKLIVVQIEIPKYIPLQLVYRLASNVQLPRNADSPYQLGCLNIDLYSYNYKPIRIDRFKNIIVFTLEPIARPFIDYDIICKMLEQRNEQLKKSFCNLHNKKLNHNCYQILTKEQLIEFEQSITKPFTGYISKVSQNQIITQQRMANAAYFRCLGVNEEMIIHHVSQTGLMPLPFFFDETCHGSQYLSRFFDLNIVNLSNIEMIVTNYQGQKYSVIVNFYNYYYYDENEQCFYECLYFVWDCEQKWQSKQAVLQNYLDYFNLKESSLQKNLPDIASDIQQRCGVKII